MLPHRTPSHALTGAILGACGLISDLGFPAGNAHAQDRLFAMLGGYENKLTPRDARPLLSKAEILFGRASPADILSLRALKASLEEPSALKISWGTLRRNQREPACEVALRDGSSLAVSATTIAPCTLGTSSRLTAAGDGYRCDIPTKSIRSLRPSPNVEYDAAWSDVCSSQNSDDLLVIRRPNGVLDSMHGVATEFTSTEIEFLIDGETYRVPFGKIEGVVFADTASTIALATKPNLGARSYLLFAGSQLLCPRIEPDSDHEGNLRAETPSGAVITLHPESPFVFDRTEQRALTPRGMTLTAVRSFSTNDYTGALPLGERLLNLAPHPYSIVGDGLNTRLMVFGRCELQVEVPAGPHTLVFELRRTHALPVPFEMFHEDAHSSMRKLIISGVGGELSDAAPPPQGEYRINGPGRIAIVVPGEEYIEFRSFLLVPEG